MTERNDHRVGPRTGSFRSSNLSPLRPDDSAALCRLAEMLERKDTFTGRVIAKVVRRIADRLDGITRERP